MSPERLTLRQELTRLLSEAPWSWHDLRRQLELPVRLLEDELRHVEKSARSAGRRLVIEPAFCPACELVFHDRSLRHLHPPSRCPRCGAKRLLGPVFSVR